MPTDNNTWVLGIEANSDMSTQLPYDYRRQHLYPIIQEMNLLVGEAAVRNNVAVEAIKPDVHFITGVGHGYPTRFLGYSEGTVYEDGAGYIAQEVRNKFVHFLACRTAQQLGHDLIENGCLGFFGYTEEILYPLNQGTTVDLLFACDAEIDLAIAEGLSVDAVEARVREKFESEIAALTEAGQDADEEEANRVLYFASTLEWALDSLKVLSPSSQSTTTSSTTGESSSGSTPDRNA